jgi:5-methylcytosine-specific restriction endonuclease McrA
MGKHLYKLGKRRCYICKRILPLNDKTFIKSKNGRLGYSYRCKECEKERGKLRKFTYKYRPRKNHKPLKLRFDILKRDAFTCQYCGRKAPDVILEIDHIHPRSKGGKNIMDNFKTACKDCNMGKSNTLLEII